MNRHRPILPAGATCLLHVGYLDYTDPNAYFSQGSKSACHRTRTVVSGGIRENLRGYLNDKYGYVRRGRCRHLHIGGTAPAGQGGKDILVKDKQALPP